MAVPKGVRIGGRQRGTPNRVTADLKGAILGALHNAGGQAYLERVAQEQPQVFCALLGKVLPTTLTSDPEAPLRIAIMSGVPRVEDQTEPEKANGQHASH